MLSLLLIPEPDRNVCNVQVLTLNVNSLLSDDEYKPINELANELELTEKERQDLLVLYEWLVMLPILSRHALYMSKAMVSQLSVVKIEDIAAALADKKQSVVLEESSIRSMFEKKIGTALAKYLEKHRMQVKERKRVCFY
jgi:hypothetical protein